MSSYSRYKEIKLALAGKEVSGYPLQRVCGSFIAELIWHGRLFSYVRYLLFTIKNRFMLSTEGALLTYTINRPDYLDLMSAYFPGLPLKQVAREGSIFDVLLGIPSSILYFLRAIKYARHSNLALKDKFILVVSVSVALKVIDRLEQVDISCERYVAFNSSYMLESFLCFYFKKRNIPTYSLQHGMYFQYVSKIPFDVINYDNVCAETLLVWGGYSLSELRGLVPEDVKLQLIGYPLDSGIKEHSENLLSDSILVLLPRNIYWEDSQKLLTLLASVSQHQYIVRPHPTIKKETVELLKDVPHMNVDAGGSMASQLQTIYKAVIGFNSTAVFEACLYKQNVCLYRVNNFEFNNPGFPTFIDEVQLSECIKNSKRLSASIFFGKRTYLA